MKSAIRFEVLGRVQGVFFRASTQSKALGLGLSGWVQNNPDGYVEGVACGQQRELDEFCAWLKVGPEQAKVTHLEVQPEPLGDWASFDIT